MDREESKILNGTVLTGASDDLIEMCGELQEEFNSFDCKDGYIAFSDGTLLRVLYCDIWRFQPICKGELFERIDIGSSSDDINDKVYFKQGLKWCVFSDKMQTEVNYKNCR